MRRKISAPVTRTFVALCVCTARDGRATVDAVAVERGLHRMTIYHHLRELRAAGLVELGQGMTRPSCVESRLRARQPLSR